MTLAIRLKETRKNRKLSQVKLANAVGVSKQAICDIELGRAKSSTHLVSIAKVLNVDPAWLNYGEGTMTPSAINLDSEEVELVSQYRLLDKNEKNFLLKIIKGLSNITLSK